MGTFSALPLFLFVTAAAVCDLRTGKIPNGLILAALAAGLVQQVFCRGIAGAFLFLTGALLSPAVLGILYYFRMIGAGDLKLLMAAGGFLGPVRILACLFWTFAAAGVYALFAVLRRGNLRERLLYFQAYVWNYVQTREWKPYRTGDSVDSRLCFAVPVWISICFCAGGIY